MNKKKTKQQKNKVKILLKWVSFFYIFKLMEKKMVVMILLVAKVVIAYYNNDFHYVNLKILIFK